MEKRTLPLVSPTHRKFAASWCLEAPEGWTVEFRPARRTDEANRAMHAKLGDIAKQVQWCGAWLSTEDWKRIATAMLKKDKFVRDVGEDGQPGNGLIVIGAQTRDMSGKEIGLIIDWCDWFGARQTPPVVWSDEKKKAARPKEMARR